MTKASRILDFYKNVDFDGELPDNIHLLNPYKENPEIRESVDQFYNKYYNDEKPRHLILGINPGRLGAGATGIPFTDTKRLQDICEIQVSGKTTHEPSSVFVYEMIDAFGGPELFYQHFYINSVCPLGFVKKSEEKLVNYNYYDSTVLTSVVSQFIIDNIRQQIDIAGTTDVCYCLGTGKNFKYLNKINTIYHFFDEIVPLEHPRYIMQYRTMQKARYIEDYVEKLQKNL